MSKREISRHSLGYGTEPLQGTEELRPCPFCGGIGQLWIVASYTHWMVECGKCEAHAEVHKERAAAIAAWNKRYPPNTEYHDVAKYYEEEAEGE